MFALWRQGDVKQTSAASLLAAMAIAAIASAFMHDYVGLALVALGAVLGMKSLYATRSSRDAIISKAEAKLLAQYEEFGVDESHGITHALAVLGHLDKAVAASPKRLAGKRIQALRLAALLHDADDRKYFASTSKSYGNATRIMRECGTAPDVIADAVRCIGYVSCSSNGNSCPPEAVSEPELLWPRWSDRLEAVGEIGVVRCYLYNKKEGKTPLACPTTPRPTTVDAALAHASPERFAQYQASGGSSVSMLDHFYDKLLPIARPPPELVRNPYLETQAMAGAAPLLDILLDYGRTGEVPVAKVEAMRLRLGMHCGADDRTI